VSDPGADALRDAGVAGLDPGDPVLVERHEQDEDEDLADHEDRQRQADEHRHVGEAVEQAPRPGGAEDPDREPDDQPDDHAANHQRQGWRQVLLEHRVHRLLGEE
jgi:hypothetical protein